MELEPDYRREVGSGSGTEIGYAVEARYDFPSPIQIAGQLFDNRWRRVQFKEGDFGVPAAPWFHEHTQKNGLLSYPAAQALRWWTHAIVEANGVGGMCLDTRIVKHEIKYHHTVTAVSVHEQIGGDDRSNCIPDWGDSPKVLLREAAEEAFSALTTCTQTAEESVVYGKIKAKIRAALNGDSRGEFKKSTSVK